MLHHDSETKVPFSPRCMNEPPRLDLHLAVSAPSPREALLVAPFYAKDPFGSYGKHVLTPALTLSAVAAATPEGWNVRVWDENLLQGAPPVEPFPSVVGITVHLTFAERAYALARWYRERGAKVVLGGLHVTACPDEASAHADSLALGEGARLWPRILADAERGELRERYVGSFGSPYQLEPSPRRELVDRASFLTTASIVATRGCRNRCGFCYLSTSGLRMPYQMRDPLDVAREIAETAEPYAVFVDNNLGARPEYLRALCDALAPLEIIWSAAVTIDVTDDPSLVRAMAMSGCTGVFVGLETLTEANLRSARKRTPSPADYARRVQLFHDHGIQVNGSFVFGFDHDGPEVFERTVRWIEENRLECATFHVLTPYPGTPLFRSLEADGRILHRDWSRYDTSHVVFQPRLMTPERLEEGYRWCYRELFGARSIWRRRPSSWRDVAPYLAMSVLYKHTNRVWPVLIRHRMTRAAWRPLVEAARRRHLRLRRRRQGAADAASQESKRPGAPGAEAPAIAA